MRRRRSIIIIIIGRRLWGLCSLVSAHTTTDSEAQKESSSLSLLREGISVSASLACCACALSFGDPPEILRRGCSSTSGGGLNHEEEEERRRRISSLSLHNSERVTTIVRVLRSLAVSSEMLVHERELDRLIRQVRRELRPLCVCDTPMTHLWHTYDDVGRSSASCGRCARAWSTSPRRSAPSGCARACGRSAGLRRRCRRVVVVALLPWRTSYGSGRVSFTTTSGSGRVLSQQR